MNDTERPRWFMSSRGDVREFPSRRAWWTDGTLVHGKTFLSMQVCIDAGHTELDGPPPHGKPIARATGGTQ